MHLAGSAEEPPLVSDSLLILMNPGLEAASFTLPPTQGSARSWELALDAAHPGTKLKSVPAQVVSGDYLVTDSPAAGQSRFYRVVTP